MRSNVISGNRSAEFTRFALIHVVAIVVFAAASLVQAATLPTPPQMFETPYVAPSGRVVNVPAGGDFQAALNDAQLGDTIVLEAGATYTGPFALPNKTSGTGWIYIQSSQYSTLPAPGKRVGLSDFGKMPSIVVAAGRGSAVQASQNAHHYRFVGIAFRPVAGSFVYTLVSIGNADVSPDTLASNITFDRCIFRGDPTVGTRRGMAMDGRYIAVVDSHFSDFKEAGADTQAVWAYNTSGPLKIVNNYLEAAGENVMFGGADSKAITLVPSDIEISRNHFFKPLSWIGSTWSVKNLLEFKSAQRVSVRGNRFENNWAAAQSGFALLITPRNQNGSASWSVTQDISIEGNVFVNIGSGFNVGGTDSDHPSARTRNIAIRQNVVTITGLNGADGRLFQLLGGPDDVTIDHNTAFTKQSYGMTEATSGDLVAGLVFTNNIVTYGSYGFIGTGTGDGFPTLTKYYASEYVFTKNAVVGGASKVYPTGNFFPLSIDAVGFVDAAAKNYRLNALSPFKGAATDGKDLGADLDWIDRLMNDVPSVTKVPTPPLSVTVQ